MMRTRYFVVVVAAILLIALAAHVPMAAADATFRNVEDEHCKIKI